MERYINDATRSDLIFSNEKMCESKNFLFSIAIPTYKRPAGLFVSILSCLKQKGCSEFEIVIVDNERKTSNEIDLEVQNLLAKAPFPCRYYSNYDNVGMFGNWDKCMSLSKGKYVVLLHDDDAILPNHLFYLEHTIQKNDPDILGTKNIPTRFISGGMLDSFLAPKKIVAQSFLKRNVYKKWIPSIGGLCVKKDYFLSTFGFKKANQDLLFNDSVFIFNAIENNHKVMSINYPMLYGVGVNTSLQLDTMIDIIHYMYVQKIHISKYRVDTTIFENIFKNTSLFVTISDSCSFWGISQSPIIAGYQKKFGVVNRKESWFFRKLYHAIKKLIL